MTEDSVSSALPKVSVSILTYQHRDFVSAAIDSVLAQNYPYLEIVVGDDGSTDGTQDIVREYARRHPGLFKLILSERNTGVTANCNRVLAQCDGDLVAFQSGDDLWEPGKLSKQVEWLKRHPEAVLCYTNTAHFDSITGKVLRLQHGRFRNRYREGGAEQMFVSLTFFNGSSVVARRSAFPPGGYDERLPMMSDWLFWLEVSRRGSIGYVGEVLARYRLHPQNASKKVGQMLADALLTLGIAESRYPEYAPLTPRLRAEVMFGSAIEHLRVGDSRRAAELLTLAMHVRVRGSALGPFPLNVLAVVLGRIGLLRLAWHVWDRSGLRSW